MPSLSVADRQTSWTGRLPPSVRPYAVLARWDRPIGTWLLLLPCWFGLALSPNLPDPVLMLAFAFGAIAMRGAGCTVNDMADRDFDRQVERTRQRPLAAGTLGMRAAALFTLLQAATGGLVLLLLPWDAALVAVLAIPLVVIYPFMKRITWWPQAFLGLTFNWGVLVGGVAVEAPLPAILLVYAGSIAWTIGYDTIYAHQDKADDALIGVRSTARLFGNATHAWLFVLYAITICGWAAGGWLAGKGLLFLAVLLFIAIYLIREARTVPIDDPTACLNAFRRHRFVGLALFAALAADSWVLSS
ncbi:MAG TPA: 4-hydroxybenzoate octaprenyltransferase [Geminicoccus sp.]|jgi:4-hydroxybenzoate polyprenyltransferase|uniref:4-hydroxybenzoate octaprenyltransferase n=1 Tax=Geminicoccus sp. TaxID=2024832 RepID=UPI002E3692A1|nr:4-hydroxybenzoate octaprenyltransferase [Geminicoccus sp.]HEX2526123.1 4-hydroxybenzoate octaprenyltransferase [Geminicoccus sp.]